MKSFQHAILDLQKFWADYGCCILQSYDMEVGAGTSHPATVLKALGPDPWHCAYVQPCRRPNDGRYGENPNRTQHYYQFQVLLKPAPDNPQELLLESLKALGLDTSQHDMRFVEDDWENPSLGAAGLGWEVWCDGMEIVQFTYFQQVGGIQCDPVSVELTYGLERIATFVQKVDNNFALDWNGAQGDKKLTYGDIFKRNEQEFSAYNFEYATIDLLLSHFHDHEAECKKLVDYQLVLPAYDQCLKANHIFNVLNARGAISVTERASYIARVRALAKACCETYLNQ